MGNGNSQQPRSNLRFEMPAGGPWGGKRIPRPAPRQIRGTMGQFVQDRIDPRQHDQFLAMPIEEQEQYRTGMQQPVPTPGRWGERIGQPPGTINTMDFIDSNNDGTDDRYQRPPWQQPQANPVFEMPPGGPWGGRPISSVSSPPPPFQQKPGFSPWYQEQLNRQQQEEDAYMQSRQMHAEARNRAMSPGGTMPRNMPRFNQAVENAGLAGINRSDWSDAQRQDFQAARRAIPRGANGGLVSQMRNRNPLPASRWSLPHYRNLV